MLVLHLVFFLFATNEKPNGEVPECLSKAFSRRMAFKTAYFEYTFESANPGVWLTPKHRYEARFAGAADVYWTEFGDEDGIVSRNGLSGQPVFGGNYACSPMRCVRCNGGKDEWTIHDGQMAVNARPTLDVGKNIGGRAPERLLDPRSAGLFPRAYSERSPADWLEDLQGGGHQWSVKKVNGLLEVTASMKEHAGAGGAFGVYVWKIDPKRDDAIVEFEGFAQEPDGSRKRLEHMTVDYQKIDGIWWPKRCETKFAKGGGEVFVFSKVEFDRKEHPSALGPDVLGIPPGLDAVDRINHDPQSGRLAMGKYIGGGTVVSRAEWESNYRNQLDLGELAAYEEKARSLGKGTYPRWWSSGTETFGIENVAHEPDLWEAYVRRWIIRQSHDVVAAAGAKATDSLSLAQVESAWAILKDCRKRAAPILKRMRDERPDSSTKSSDSPAGKERESATAKLKNQTGSTGTNTHSPTKKKLTRYEQELESIFQSLKSRLNGLLTTKQENASEKEAGN